MAGLPAAGFRLPASGFRLSAFGYRISDIGHRTSDIGYPLSGIAADPVQVGGAAEEERVLGGRDGRQRRAVELVRRQRFSAACLHYGGAAVLVEKVNASVGQQRGCGKTVAEPLLPPH